MSRAAQDSWDDGEAYERYMGRWSRVAAGEFILWLDRPPGERWVDVGCGTGSLIKAILAEGTPASVAGIEPSDTYLALARTSLVDERLTLLPGSAVEMPLADASADVLASAFVLNFVTEPAAGLQEMLRVSRPGGTVSAMVWDYREGMQFIRRFWDAAIELDPGARQLDEGRRFPMCRPEPLAELFESARLQGVRVGAIEIATRFEDFGDFWEPFVGGPGPAPGYVATLSDRRRNALRSRLEEVLADDGEGPIEMTARAWAVAGVKAAD